MKKKMFSLVLAVALLAGAAVSAMAVDGTEIDSPFVDSPSIPTDVESDNNEIEVVTDNVVTGGYIRQKGVAETRPLEMIDYPVIKITTLNMSSQANAAVDAANPGATHEQKAGMMTESGLTYGKNASVNETADRYRDAETTLTFPAPGVKVGSRVMVARINSGSMEFISASAGNGTVSFDVQPSKLGTFVLMTRAQ